LIPERRAASAAAGDPREAVEMPAGEALLDAVFANGGAGLCLLDPAGRVVRVNAPWLAAAGLREADAVGRGIWELFPASPPELRALHDRVRAGETVDVPMHR
jgi:PAS domain S-box-containing protein